MKIFLSGTDTGPNKDAVKTLIDQGEPLLYNLTSFWYARKDLTFTTRLRDASELVMIDSGAFSMQGGARTNWEDYTKAYAAFIKKFDAPNVVGYMEMDIDKVVGYQEVLRLRDILYRESGVPEKIVPVWHKNRGITDYLQMCAEHAGRTVAVTGFRNEEIRDDQYALFVNEAHKAGARIHGLGLTRREILDAVPFDYVDSAAWAVGAVYGRVAGYDVSHAQSKTPARINGYKTAYRAGMRMQRHYEAKWRRLHSPVKGS